MQGIPQVIFSLIMLAENGKLAPTNKEDNDRGERYC